MEAYGKILLIAMPVFLALVLFEKWWGWRRGRDTVRNMDMISSLSSGITNVTKDVLGLSIAIIGYGWLVTRLAIVHVSATPLTSIIAFLALDFAGYWVHRISHEYNIFWNNHIIHHSSEEFNLACALRQSISSIVRIFAIFLLPAALLGVPEKVIAIVAPIQLFSQFWYHTQHIRKMGWLEKIIVTPSHHRVHHAINPEYLDKNYSQIFIVWDKWFGTFQEELSEIPPVYGITRPVRTWNPVRINFAHLWLLITDAWRTQRWTDKLRIWFMPTGWRPADVAERFPVYKIADVYRFDKYDTPSPLWLAAWCWFQLCALLVFIAWLFGHIAVIGSPGIFVYGGFVFLSVYSLTELMDGNRYSLAWECARNILGTWCIYHYSGWFGAATLLPWIDELLLAYFALSTVFTAYIVLNRLPLISPVRA
ncbi:MAG: sterol desaturase family protein, partial [Bacteroidetes bacterium]|nr:sterol desaturase family protein [Bacteroidota bacterium]